MSNNYARRQPVDESMNPIQNAPTPFPARASWNIQNQVASSVINLNPNTTRLEIGSIGPVTSQGIVIKWIPTTDTTSASVVSSGLSQANFDNWIPTNQTRWFTVPRETQGTPINPNVQTGSIYGLYQRLAWINAGITPSSIIANEY